MDKRDWIITSCKKCQGSRRISLYDSTNILLDDVMAHNIELLVYLGKKSLKLKLNGVPSFLIEAFDWLGKNNSLQVEGIFRKEGNANRMKNTWRVFCGLSPIPADCNAHDVCSLIKRFFREVKKPIFTENESKILNFAEDFKDHLLADSIFTVIERLPTSHVSTLAFLMRQLKRVSESSEANQMNLENLATVFAPSLFREDFMHGIKKKNVSQNEFLTAIRRRNDLQIAVIKLLIQTSNLIGITQSNGVNGVGSTVVARENFRSHSSFVRQEVFLKPDLRLEKPAHLYQGTISKTAELLQPMSKPIETQSETIPNSAGVKREIYQRPLELRENMLFKPTEIPKETFSKSTNVRQQTNSEAVNVRERVFAQVVEVQDDEKNHEKKEFASINFSHSDSFKEHITSCKMSKDFFPQTVACDLASPISNRPSLAYFQRNNRGFVRQRISQFGRLAITDEGDEDKIEP